MEIKLYKLWNKETGKFNAGGDHWTSKGKCWNQRNHLTTKLTSHCRDTVRMLNFRGWKNGKPVRDISDEEYHFYHDDANKQAMYDRFIPESWIVIEITNTGARELCKARDWLKQ